MPEQRYTLDHLINYIALFMHLTGEKPKSLEVTPDFYTWYIQEIIRNAEVMNLNQALKDGKCVFMGMELTKKVKIHTK